MKKTLIALAVAASAVVSGSAMAAGWEQNGSGGSVDLGGTLTPVAKVTPWEVKTGDAVTGLDGQVQKGQQAVKIAVNKAIPVLGIRTQTTQAFQGQAGISPQISYGDAVNLDGFSNGVTNVYMEVRNTQGEKIGMLTAPFFAGAEVSQVNGSRDYKYFLYANEAGDGFFGGLPKNTDGATNDISTKLNAISSEFTANYTTQGVMEYDKTYGRTSFNAGSVTYSAYYGSGIRSGDTLSITLDQAASGDAPIQWNASLPVTVTYM